MPPERTDSPQECPAGVRDLLALSVPLERSALQAALACAPVESSISTGNSTNFPLYRAE
jgi:hypothetical protein